MESTRTGQFEVIIVGAGHAGAQAAIALRQSGFDGSVAILGDESEPPYERPPLSKEYFAGEKSFERIQVRPADFWAERDIDRITHHCDIVETGNDSWRLRNRS